MFSPRQCPSLHELGLSQHLVRAIRSLYDNTGSLEKRRWLTRPVRQYRATLGAMGSDAFLGESLAESSFDGQLENVEARRPSTPVAGCVSQSRPSSAFRVGGPPGVASRPASANKVSRGVGPRLCAPGAPYDSCRSRRPWSARSSQTSATSLGGSTKGLAHYVPEGQVACGTCDCTVDSTCFNCMCSVAEPPLLRRQGRRPSDVLLMQRSASARRRPAARPTAVTQADELQSGRDVRARQMKQARIRDWLARKEAELEVRRRQRQEEEMLQQQKKQMEVSQRDRQEAELQRQRSGRLRFAARRRQEMDLELQQHRACPLSAREPRGNRDCQAVKGRTLAAYATPRPGSQRRERPGSARAALRLRRPSKS